MEALSNLGINLPILIAQIINVAILVWVLNRFLYQPILKNLQQRKKLIENAVLQSKKIEEKTKEADKLIREKVSQTKLEAEKIIQTAKEMAAKHKAEVMENIKKETENLWKKNKLTLAQEKEKMLAEIESYILSTALVLTKKVLQERIDPSHLENLLTDEIKNIPSPIKKHAS